MAVSLVPLPMLSSKVHFKTSIEYFYFFKFSFPVAKDDLTCTDIGNGCQDIEEGTTNTTISATDISICCCDTDLCNGAEGIYFSALTLFFTLTIIIMIM